MQKINRIISRFTSTVIALLVAVVVGISYWSASTSERVALAAGFGLFSVDIGLIALGFKLYWFIKEKVHVRGALFALISVGLLKFFGVFTALYISLYSFNLPGLYFAAGSLLSLLAICSLGVLQQSRIPCDSQFVN